MMIKVRLLGVFIAAFLFCLSLNAQDSISVDFSVVIPETVKLSQVQRAELRLKLETVIARTNLSGDSENTPFVIVPNVTIGDVKNTGGGINPIKLVQGELHVFVKNRYDGTIYHELTMPLQKTLQGGADKDEMLQLIKSIQPKDSRFVRFMKTAKKRILKRYQDKEIVLP